MTSDISLTPHFELREFTKSATARKHGIDNTPPAEAVDNLRTLCFHTLEPLREKLGLPVVIASGYRTKALNSMLVHSSERSQHMLGQAADFWVQGAKLKVQGEEAPSRRELLIRAFRLIITDESIDFDQLILYPTFIHVSYVSKKGNRQKLTRGFSNGTYAALSRTQALALE